MLFDLMKIIDGTVPERWQRDGIKADVMKKVEAAEQTTTGSGVMLQRLLNGQSPHPPPSTKEIKMLEWVRLNGNSNTRRTYDAGFRGFVRYLDEEKINIDAVKPCDIADYLRLRHEDRNVSASTIAGDRAAIGDGLKNTRARGMHLDPLVKDAMKICMNNAAQSKPKQHVSAELMRALVQMLHAKSGATWLDHRNVALMLTMMLGMLREGEAVEIRMDDVQMRMIEQAAAAGGGEVVDSITITIRCSKTDQAKKGASVTLATNSADPIMCPMRVLQEYLDIRRAAGVQSEWLFPKDGGAAMSKSTPCGIVQRMVADANQLAMRDEGIEDKWGLPEAYGSHSLRRGGVTEARASGVPMLEIQRHGRWKTATVYSYVGPTDDQRRKVTENMFAAAGTIMKSISAPNTPAKNLKSPRKPKVTVHPLKLKSTVSDTTPKKRKRVDSDNEDAPEAVKEAERVVDALFMEQLQQGYGETIEEKKPKSKKSKKFTAATNLETRFDPSGVTIASEPKSMKTVPARAAAKKAAQMMKEQV